MMEAGATEAHEVTTAWYGAGRAVGAPRPTTELGLLWFNLSPRPWTSLALIPAHPKGSALPLVHALAAAAEALEGADVQVLDVRSMFLRSAPERIAKLKGALRPRERLLISLPSILDEPAAIPVAMAADRCVLCVCLDEADLASARRTFASIARGRWLGSVTVRPARPKVVTPLEKAEAAFFAEGS